MEKQYFEPEDFDFLHEVDVRVLTDKNLTPIEKVVLLRFYVEDIATIWETTEETAGILGMKMQTVGVAKRSLVKKGYLQVLGDDGRGKCYRPLFHKIRGNNGIESRHEQFGFWNERGSDGSGTNL